MISVCGVVSWSPFPFSGPDAGLVAEERASSVWFECSEGTLACRPRRDAARKLPEGLSTPQAALDLPRSVLLGGAFSRCRLTVAGSCRRREALGLHVAPQRPRARLSLSLRPMSVLARADL